MPGAAPVHFPVAVAGLDPRDECGGHGIVGDGVQRVVELGEGGGGRRGAGVDEGAEHVADLRHGGGRGQVVADDVPDHGGAGAVGQEEDVVPVAADVVGLAGRAVDGGRGERRPR
jgi:hypothetical protein